MSRNFSIFIAEDEDHIRNELVSTLTEFPQLQLSGSAKNGEEALKKVLLEAYDILFLDIKLPGISGIELIRQLKSQRNKMPEVVFITGYQEHAVEAFEFGATDFLVKPFSFARLSLAVDRVCDKLSDQAAAKSEVGLAYKDSSVIKIIDYDQIFYIEAKGPTSLVHSAEGPVKVSQLLKKIQKRLPGSTFIRIHKRFIANINKISSIHASSGGEYHLFLEDHENTKLRIGRNYIKNLRYSLGV